MSYYLRDGRRCQMLEWAAKFEDNDYKIVEQTQVTPSIMVSTVWLGLDHNFIQGGRPIIFETMIFRDGRGADQERYSTEEEARAGHTRMVSRVWAELHGATWFETPKEKQ